MKMHCMEVHSWSLDGDEVKHFRGKTCSLLFWSSVMEAIWYIIYRQKTTKRAAISEIKAVSISSKLLKNIFDNSTIRNHLLCWFVIVWYGPPVPSNIWFKSKSCKVCIVIASHFGVGASLTFWRCWLSHLAQLNLCFIWFIQYLVVEWKWLI